MYLPVNRCLLSLFFTAVAFVLGDATGAPVVRIGGLFALEDPRYREAVVCVDDADLRLAINIFVRK